MSNIVRFIGIGDVETSRRYGVTLFQRHLYRQIPRHCPLTPSHSLDSLISTEVL